ncbi:hypothetical protein PPROV_000241100 [Pycnococcus provasolii]|uniref:Uncharacterized protein n=1 Tax=Pycnococcus provasolii TaxID=41880 RepID=A0A830H8S2_9CHLO|nr:hypothetical protein PPROV_000241100 [Pycnococcus provasolii]
MARAMAMSPAMSAATVARSSSRRRLLIAMNSAALVPTKSNSCKAAQTDEAFEAALKRAEQTLNEADTFFASGEYESAYEKYTELVRSSENVSIVLNERARFGRACALYEQGRDRQAVILLEDLVLRRQLGLDAEKAAALAVALYAMKRDEEAEDIYATATAIMPKLTKGYVPPRWGPRLLAAKDRFDRLL